MKNTWHSFFLVNIGLILAVLFFLVACKDPSGGGWSCIKSIGDTYYCFESSDSSNCADQGGTLISGTCGDAGYTINCSGLPSYSYFKVCPTY